MSRIELHPEARKEYLAALGWYRERGVHLARQFAMAFDAAVSRIREAP